MYTGDALNNNEISTVSNGMAIVLCVSLEFFSIFIEGDNISATTQGRMPLKTRYTTGLLL